jgi:Chaperone for flagella basal body P-ring formation
MQLISASWLLGFAWLFGSGAAYAQSGCTSDGHRVVGQQWDPVMGKAWSLIADCAHPERPARLMASVGGAMATASAMAGVPVAALRPLLVRAGDLVRLWAQTATVRIEMVGVAEQSAGAGEHVVVRVSRQRIDGTVRGAGDVEMGR